MKKKVFAITFIVLFVTAVVWLVIEGSKPEALPLGSKLPEIEFESFDGIRIIKSDTLHKTVVMFFSKKCPHCKYELNVLNENAGKIKGTNFYLITLDKDIFTNGFTDRYLKLRVSENIKFGVVKKDEYKNKYGTIVTPAFFFFDKNGMLFSKLKGETKLERILDEINKVSVTRVKSRTRGKTEKSGIK